MKKNMGTADRTIRVIVAIVVAALIFTGKITGVAAVVLGIVAGIFILTAFVSFCPLYWPFGLSTLRKKKQ